jgi:hypothetical protein
VVLAYGDRRSSWHSILVEYEQSALGDRMVSRRDCGEPLMTTLPTGLTTTPQPPAPLFTMPIGLKTAELDKVDRLLTQEDAVDKQYAERALLPMAVKPQGYSRRAASPILRSFIRTFGQGSADNFQPEISGMAERFLVRHIYH